MTDWLFSQTIAPSSIAATVGLAKEAGCGLLIRCGHEWGDPSRPLKNPPARVQAIAEQCAAEGIPAGLWSWSHPDHLTAYFEAIDAASEGWRPAVFVSDVEHNAKRCPWKTHPLKRQLAEQLIALHRETLDVPLVVTSYGAVHIHPTMPWAELLPCGVTFGGQWQTVNRALMERSKAVLRELLGRDPMIEPCGGLQAEGSTPKTPVELAAHMADLDAVFGEGPRSWWTIELLKKALQLAAVLRG